MVGIVIVSHSEKIAEGVVELSSQMAHGDIKIIAAGGTDDGRIGTDITKIIDAIAEADDGDGVLVLVDLGSAIMSAEMAIELLVDEQRERVIIADAPLVEGSIVAAIQASIGSNLEEVNQACEESKYLSKKQ